MKETGSHIGKSKTKVEGQIPLHVINVARIFVKEGFQCYLTGGAVRDIVMNDTPNDYDIATDAKPKDVQNIFPKAIATGAKFGAMIVLSKDAKGENHPVDVITFRSEADYVDGRWPTNVEFTNDVFKDLGRRDFTWNAMALDLSGVGELANDPEELKKHLKPRKSGETDDMYEGEFEIIDPFGGQEDIKKEVVRAVGTPVERFKEDGLRAFKACRMAAQLGFQIDPETFEAMKATTGVASKVSMERIRDEFMKMLKNSVEPSIGIELMRESGLLKLFLPELEEGFGVKQPEEYHRHDVYYHALACVDAAADEVKLAALFHDIAKPRKVFEGKDGRLHFYGHDAEGAKMVGQIMKRMKFSRDEIDRVARLVRWHMFYFPYYDQETGRKLKTPKKRFDGEWTDAAIRRFIQRVGGEENIDDLFALRIADATCTREGGFDEREIEALEERISEVRQQDMALKVTDLEIGGEDLKALGVKPGPKMGEILNRLLEEVIENPTLNTKEKLLELAEGMKG